MSGSPATRLESEVASAQTAESTRNAEHLRTDHLLDNIGSRALSGGFVTIMAQVAKFALNFGAAAILARLLSPREFGLVGMVMGVTGLVGIFKELGLSTATVQKQNITQGQVSNLFWINFGVSGIVTLVSCAISPLVGKFYHDPRVTWIMVALSFTFLLTGTTVQHRALLTRQMRFRAVAVIEVSSMFVGFLTACLLAWKGFAYWALVAQQLANAITCLVLTWHESKWRPNWPQRNTGVRPLLSFGAHLTVADFIGRLSVNSDTVLIGKFFGAIPLGLYTRASVLLERPMEQVFAPINAVMDPVLARLQNDPPRYRRTFMRTFEGLAMIVFPFAAICLALARPMVLVILGPKWIDVVPLFSAFALVAISSPMSSVVSWIFQSQGRGQDQLSSHTAAGVVTVLAYVIGLIWGPLGLIISLAISSMIIRLPIVYYMAGRRGPVSTSDLWIGFVSQFPAWITVYIATLGTRLFFANAQPIVQLLICAPVGLVLGGVMLLPFHRSRESAFYAFNMVKGVLVRQRSTA